MSTLVIVESPTKARTIRKFLPSEYQVEASMGHVRDLPASADDIPEEYKSEKWARLGVNVEADFQPLYVISKDKVKVVKQLQSAIKQAKEVILATDEDREGESISWHLLEILKPKVPIKRMVFHEITQEAIREALQNCRQLDQQRVKAQETRRILDRLVGYTVSPLLWGKIAPNLSAGRVQSVAVRLLVNREQQRRAFRVGTYWDIIAKLATQSQPHNLFDSKLITLNGVKIATGSDFDESTGQIATGRNVLLLSESEAIALVARLTGKPFTVTDLETRPVTRKPAPPFTTSTLQQEANRKLRLGARDTMRIAQSLYEQGYITYMRTDSVHLSDQAIEAARNCVLAMYGKSYLSPKARQYTTKSKGAQEAHEAIRPAGSTFRIPSETGLADREYDLYDLIWKRTVASQMADARQTHITVNLIVEDAGFRSHGKRIDFPGFLRAYVEGSDDPNAALENQEIILPPLSIGDHPNCQNLEAVGHETQPPARFTEASLVKMLESEGVGRPSTYASIIGTIIDRGYAQKMGNALVPTWMGFAVTNLLEKHFPDLVDTGFTAKMEQTLDDISTGKVKSLPYLDKFYRGENGLEQQVKKRESEIDEISARTIPLSDLDSNISIRIGKFGPYVEIVTDQGIKKASIPPEIPPDQLTLSQIELILEQKSQTPDQIIIGTDPTTNQTIYGMIGPYGPYVQLGQPSEQNKKPKRTSLPKSMKLEDVTLEIAIGLLALPRLLGEHPDTKGKIKAAIGPYGPYVLHDQGKNGKDYRALKAIDNILTINLERALAILAEPKKERTKGSTTPPLKELGVHPDTNEPINIYQGKYGPYIKYQKTNISVPKQEPIEDMTIEKALQLLAEKTTSKDSNPQTASKTKTTTTKKKTRNPNSKSRKK